MCLLVCSQWECFCTDRRTEIINGARILLNAWTLFLLMRFVSPLRCRQITGATTATLGDCWSISFGDGGLCEHSDPETFKTTLQARQPRSPSESLWKSNNPARRRDTAWDWVEWASTDCTTLARHTHTHTHTDTAGRKKLFVVVFFLIFTVRGGFWFAPVLSVVSLRVFKPVIQTTATNCV